MRKTIILKTFQFITDDVPYIWTSGRLCDFKGCESRKDLEPRNILGWFWSANREKISPTNTVSLQFDNIKILSTQTNYVADTYIGLIIVPKI